MQKRFLFDKLFGGPMHSRVIALDHHQRYIAFPRLTKMPYISFSDDPVMPVEVRSEVYVAHEMRWGSYDVLFYAHSSKKGPEAFDMLVRYMLRGAREIT